jgi:hypothetical protein
MAGLLLIGFIVFCFYFAFHDAGTRRRVSKLISSVESAQSHLADTYHDNMLATEIFINNGIPMGDILEAQKDNQERFIAMTQINGKLCERYRNKPSKLQEQLTDWLALIELYQKLTTSRLDTEMDTGMVATLSGRMTELENRITHRA